MTIADQIDIYLKTQLAKIRTGQTITLFNGTVYTFRTDAGLLVDKHLEYTEHPDARPSIAFFTGKNVTSTDGDPAPELGMENHTLSITVQGFIESDKAGTEGDDLKLDLVSALRGDPWWNGLIVDVQNFTTDSAVSVGDIVYTDVNITFDVLYTAPFGSE